ncbi:hypothetical protein MTO96_052059 [Rhipicephalus appendiculatus]
MKKMALSISVTLPFLGPAWKSGSRWVRRHRARVRYKPSTCIALCRCDPLHVGHHVLLLEAPACKWKAIYRVQAVAGQLRCAEFHPDGVTVAVAGRDSAVRVYDLRNKRLLQEYNAHEGMVNSMHFHPSGDYLVTGASDSLTRVFDVLKGRLLYTLVTHMKPVHAVCFSHNGSHFATGGDDCQVFLWKSGDAEMAAAEQSGNGDAGTQSCRNGDPAPTAPSTKPVAVVRSVAQVSSLNQASYDPMQQVTPASGPNLEAKLDRAISQINARLDQLSQEVLLYLEVTREAHVLASAFVVVLKVLRDH